MNAVRCTQSHPAAGTCSSRQIELGGGRLPERVRANVARDADHRFIVGALAIGSGLATRDSFSDRILVRGKPHARALR